MNMIFSRLMLAAILAFGTVSLISPASAYEKGKPVCYKGGTFNPKSGKCDFGPGTTGAPGTGYGQDDAVVNAGFRNDCAAHGGTVYTAAEWSTMGGKPLATGVTEHCYRPATWGVDPK